MIIVTGGAGFIGSCMVSRLNQAGRKDILVVDRLGTGEKWRNLRKLHYWDYLDKDDLFTFLANKPNLDAVIHLGAGAASEQDADYLMANNYRYSFNLARYCLEQDVRMIYASSVDTYGDGRQGFVDDEDRLAQLSPHSVSGYTKHVFDLKAKREGWLNKLAGLKFFNVYGPNEYHKGDAASLVYRAFRQIQAQGYVALSQVHPDNPQKHDFIFVMDVVDAMLGLLAKPTVSGLFNLGSGEAHSYTDLAVKVFHAMGLEPDIRTAPSSQINNKPVDVQASMAKLQSKGLGQVNFSLEEGIEHYLHQYLLRADRYY